VSGGAVRSGSNGGSKKRAGGGRLSQGEAIQRQQRIVHLREIDRLTYAQIAEEVGMGEKEARLAYYRYVNEVAPLMAAPSADEEIAEALRTLDDLKQRLWGIVDKGENENARIGAARTIVELTFRSLELRQNLGLLPRPISQVVDHAWMAEQIGEVFEKHDVPAEAQDEIKQVFVDAMKETP
jgi:hypothetical protein